MIDNFQREIDYFRISVTDRCNLRCSYCMPEKGVRWLPASEILTFEEIWQVCREAAALGMKKIKLTGGEPLVRKDIPKLIAMLREIPGITSVTMTTNGVLLAEYMDALVKSGLSAVNISLDTMDAAKYAQITGRDAFSQVMEGLEASVEAGMTTRVNTVLTGEDVEEDWRKLLSLAEKWPVDVRFIELMPIGMGKKQKGYSGEWLLQRIKDEYPDIRGEALSHGNGPAVYYHIPGFAGSIGFINAIHGKFCSSCNRIRMSADGQIKPCLCYGETLDLKRVVRNGTGENIRSLLKKAVEAKPQGHCFHQKEKISETKEMVSIGG